MDSPACLGCREGDPIIADLQSRHAQLEARVERLTRQLAQGLESLEPHTPPDQLRPTLGRELTSAAEPYRVEVAAGPLAEGSVAVVVPLTWSDPTGGADTMRVL
jgi:hypothetical protein